MSRRFALLTALVAVVLTTLGLWAQVLPTAVIEGPATLGVGANLTVSGARSTAAPGASVVSYRWRLDAGSVIVTSDPSHTFAASSGALGVGAHTVELVVTDDGGNQSSPATLRVIVTDTLAPTAVIQAPSSIPVGTDLIVSGANSFDIGGRITSYRWTLDGGAPVDTSSASITFAAATTPLAVGLHTVQLVVTDDSGNQSSPAAATVRVIDSGIPTAVLEAPANVALGASFTLDGSRSFDVGGRIIEYRWTVGARPVAVTGDPTFNVVVSAAQPLAVGTHVMQLVVVDDSGNQSSPAIASVQVVDASRPTAVITAPATVPVGQSFTVTGERSFAAGRIVRYTWQLDSQTPVETAEPSFIVSVDPAAPLAVGAHTITLVVTDDSGNDSAAASARVIVVDSLRPTAVIDAEALQLFGSDLTASGALSFDIGGRITEYRWTLDGGPVVVTSTPAVAFPFSAATPFLPGPHDITLVVVDDSGNESSPDTARVRVTDGLAPTAVVEVPARVSVGQSVTVLGGRSFDIGGSIVEYRFTLDSEPTIVTETPSVIVGASPAAPLAVGRHTVSLVVVDDSGNESSADVAPFIVVDDLAPTAVVEAPATIVSGTTLTASGVRSVDIGGRITEYQWTLDGGTPFVTPDATRTFGVAGTPPLGEGRHTIQLVVVDDSGNTSSPDTASVDVLPPPDLTPPSIVITSPAPGAVFGLKAAVTAAFTCADTESGVASCVGSVANGAALDTATVGTKTFTVTARDNAGNSVTVTRTYSVQFVFTGFFQPVDNLPMVNVGKAGRTFPLKWRLADAAGALVTRLDAVADIRESAIACDGSPDDVLEEQLELVEASKLIYSTADSQFVFQWRTQPGVTGCRLLQLTLTDGTRHWARFRLR